MSEYEIGQLTRSIKEAQTKLDKYKALERLKKNRDFNQIINEGFLQEEAIRLVHLKAHPAMQTIAHQESIIKQIDAIGILASFFEVIGMEARQAERSIEGDEETLEQLRKGGE